MKILLIDVNCKNSSTGKIVYDLYTNIKEKTFFEKTDVTFYPIYKEDLKRYVESGDPLDKAGSYGIQEWIGYIGIEKIVGSYFNVMGLPVKRLYDELKEFIKQL